MITPARRSRSNGHGGSRRVVATNRSPIGGRRDQPQQALVDGERGDLVQVVQDQHDRCAVVGQDRGDPSGHGLHVVVGDDPPQVRGRPLAEDRGDRGRDRRPQRPHVILGRAERDPRRGPACSALGQPRTSQQRLPPARGGGDQRAAGLQAGGQPGVQPGTGHQMRGQRHRELAVPVAGAPLGAWPRGHRRFSSCAHETRSPRCPDHERGGTRETDVTADYAFRISGRVPPALTAVLEPLKSVETAPTPCWWVR